MNYAITSQAFTLGGCTSPFWPTARRDKDPVTKRTQNKYLKKKNRFNLKDSIISQL